MTQFKQYKGTFIYEMRPITEDEVRQYQQNGYMDIEDQEESLSISWLDIESGSPKIGDMIARSPGDPGYYWLVSEQQLKDNFEEV